MTCPHARDLRLEFGTIQSELRAAQKALDEVLDAQKREVGPALTIIGRARQHMISLARRLDELDPEDADDDER
jgi:hypothetical protein